MDENAEFPWLNAWMIFVSVAGLSLAAREFICRARGPTFWVGEVVTVVALLIVGIVGMARWPKLSASGDGHGASLGEIGETYRTAWRTLRRERWILVAFGFIAAVNLVGGMFDTTSGVLISIHRYGGRPPNMVPLEVPWYEVLVTRLSGLITVVQRSALDFLLPRAGLSRNMPSVILFALVVLASLAWVRRRLTTISADPEYARDAGALRAFIAPLVVVSLATVTGGSWYYFRMRSVLLHAHAANTRSILTGYGALGGTVLCSLAGIVFAVIASGVLISGLAVSLGRRKHGEPVTRETFIRDVVRYFQPVAGVYLILAVAGFLLNLPSLLSACLRSPLPWVSVSIPVLWLYALLMLAFVFAPYAAVFRGFGAWRALGQSIRDWRRNPWETLSFLAVGCSILVVPLMLLMLANNYFGKWSWLHIPYTAVYVLFSALAAAFMAVAVWEFYWRISGTHSSEGSAL